MKQLILTLIFSFLGISVAAASDFNCQSQIFSDPAFGRYHAEFFISISSQSSHLIEISGDFFGENDGRRGMVLDIMPSDKTLPKVIGGKMVYHFIQKSDSIGSLPREIQLYLDLSKQPQLGQLIIRYSPDLHKAPDDFRLSCQVVK